MNPRNYQQSRMMELHADLFSFTRDNIMTRMDPDGQEGRRALDFKNAAASGAYDPDDLKDQSSHPNKRGSQALCDDNYNVVLTAVERRPPEECSAVFCPYDGSRCDQCHRGPRF